MSSILISFTDKTSAVMDMAEIVHLRGSWPRRWTEVATRTRSDAETLAYNLNGDVIKHDDPVFPFVVQPFDSEPKEHRETSMINIQIFHFDTRPDTIRCGTQGVDLSGFLSQYGKHWPSDWDYVKVNNRAVAENIAGHVNGVVFTESFNSFVVRSAAEFERKVQEAEPPSDLFLKYAEPTPLDIAFRVLLNCPRAVVEESVADLRRTGCLSTSEAEAFWNLYNAE